MKRKTLAVMAVMLIVGSMIGCSRKEYIAAPEERPGQPRQADPRHIETETRAPYVIDLPVEN